MKRKCEWCKSTLGADAFPIEIGVDVNGEEVKGFICDNERCFSNYLRDEKASMNFTGVKKWNERQSQFV